MPNSKERVKIYILLSSAFITTNNYIFFAFDYLAHFSFYFIFSASSNTNTSLFLVVFDLRSFSNRFLLCFYIVLFILVTFSCLEMRAAPNHNFLSAFTCAHLPLATARADLHLPQFITNHFLLLPFVLIILVS